MLNSYFPSRTSQFLTQCRNYIVSGYPLYPGLSASEFSPNGGYLSGPLTLTNPGGISIVYYTLDGSDPRISDIVQLVPNTEIPLEVKNITLSGATATVKLPNHGFVNGQTIAISGANQLQYNTSAAVIFNVTQDTFDYTVPIAPAPPASPASGTIYVTPYGITRNGSSAIVTLPGHGYAVGDRVLITGATQSDYNGIVTISGVTFNTFSYSISNSPASPATGTIYIRRVDKPVSSITFSGITATATVASHGFTTGDLVRIVGAALSQYNGDFIITVIDSDTFTYNMASVPSSNASGIIAAIKVVSPTAQRYTGPITLAQSVRVMVRVLNGRTWSALNDAQFYVNTPAAAGNLAVTEVNYHPLTPDAGSIYNTNDFQFIELKNISAETIDLSDLQLSLGNQIAFNFTGSAVTTLSPGAFVLIVENREALLSRYGGGIASQIAGEFNGELDFDSQRICLRDFAGQIIVEFTYSDSGAWPSRADGAGSSLETVNTAANYNNSANWRSSSEYLGTPGAAGVGPLGSVVVNEVLSHADYPLYDSIELYNTTNAAIDISGWYISDAGDKLKKYRIPNGTLLGPYEYRVFTEEQFGISSFSAATQPGDGDAITQELGATLFLSGSTWRKIPLPYTVTANTVLEFDYMSTNQGDVQGIGFDENNTPSSNRLFQLYGTTSWGLSNYKNYSSSAPNWKHYAIPVGASYTGSMALPGVRQRRRLERRHRLFQKCESLRKHAGHDSGRRFRRLLQPQRVARRRRVADAGRPLGQFDLFRRSRRFRPVALRRIVRPLAQRRRRPVSHGKPHLRPGKRLSRQRAADRAAFDHRSNVPSQRQRRPKSRRLRIRRDLQSHGNGRHADQLAAAQRSGFRLCRRHGHQFARGLARAALRSVAYGKRRETGQFQEQNTASAHR